MPDQLDRLIATIAQDLCDENEGPGSWNVYEEEDRKSYRDPVSDVLTWLHDHGYRILSADGRPLRPHEPDPAGSELVDDTADAHE